MATNINPIGASPGNPGKIKFKCVIWDNCPIYERMQQDQAFIFSPETIQFAPQNLRNKLVTIPGLDGAFLRPIPNFYIHNFISFIKPGYVESSSNKTKKTSNIDEYSWNDVLPIEYLQFLGLDNNITSDFLTVNDGNAISSSIGSHQTWISDGSLYCSVNLLPSEYNSIQNIQKPEEIVAKSFCAKWSYRYEPISQGVFLVAVEDRFYTTFLNSGTVCIPCTNGVYMPGDPIQVMKDNNCEDKFKVSYKTYKNINPGMHWRMLKRTPVFQGEDFSIEFSTKANSSLNTVGEGDFRMLDKFKHLDVSSNIGSTVCGALNGDGLLDNSKNEKILDAIKKVYDFSRQIYYIIEIGVDHPLHNYFIIIAENSYPIFLHAGIVPGLKCSLQEDVQKSPPAEDKNDGGVPQCSTIGGETRGGRSRTDNPSITPLKEVTIATLGKEKIIRKLSTYDAESSYSLLNQDKLRVNIRQHGGNIVVVFSGKEDRPWVISRKDIDPSLTPITEENQAPIPISDSQVQYKTVQMLIPFSQIAIMGGNRKCGFSFAPIIYNSLDSYVMPQSFSVQGPVEPDEIEFLWRDKGKSIDPEVSVNLNGPQYTNEAGVYGELYADPEDKDKKTKGKAKFTLTYAKNVQFPWVKNNGKAPDMMKNTDAYNAGIKESYIGVNASECTKSQGSNANNSKLMQASIDVVPGGYLFPAIDGGNPWPLANCVTPVVYVLRMYVPPKGSIFKKTPVDVSHHVLSFSDEWSETDWQTLEHNGSISFLVTDGMKFRNNQANFLYYLADKTFYIQISIWWEEGIIPAPVDPRDRIVFTGFCHGGVMLTETNKEVLDCKIHDYSKILKDQFFMNSPFFDRMQDVNAIKDILGLAGLRDGEDNSSSFEPGSLLRVLCSSVDKGGWYSFFFNGDKIYNREYTLPGSYDMLQSPFLRFTDGSSFWDAIQKMSLLSNKVAFFDRLGVFYFNPLPYDQELFGGQSGSQTNWTIQDWTKFSKSDFFATPKSSSECADLSKQIIGDYKVERIVQDVMNEIKIISTSPNGEIFVAGHTNYASLNDPDSPGFIGYRKPFLQMDGIFGSENNVKWMVKNYTKMFTPPIKVSFRALGRNNIKALDVITFQPLGSREKQPLIVSSVKSEIDASKNTWFQDFECLWLFPRQDIQWGRTNEIGLGLDGSISGASISQGLN